MSYLAMTAAPIEQYDENKKGTQEVINNLKKINKQNRTRRRLETSKPNIESNERYPSKSTHDELESDFGNDNNLEDFTPMPTPESAGVERRKEREVLKDEERNKIQNKPVSSYLNGSNQHSEQPSNINDVPMGSDINLDDYRKNISAYYQQPQNNATQPVTQKTELTEKLNYLIHLLEEQQDEKTQNVTEEVILYSFLGIFIIFVVDSFARVGKYVR